MSSYMYSIFIAETLLYYCMVSHVQYSVNIPKNCLFVHDYLMFCIWYLPAAFLTQTVCVDEMTVKFEIWDTAGQERYHSLAPMYYRGAQAAIIVYDITSQVDSAVLLLMKLPYLHAYKSSLTCNMHINQLIYLL